LLSVAGDEVDEDWEGFAWETLNRGLRVANFLRQIVLVVASLVAIGLLIALIGALVGDLESGERVAVMVYALAGFLFWAMLLGVLYAIASLLEVQSSALALSLPNGDEGEESR
jgi:hypothetical protein